VESDFPTILAAMDQPSVDGVNTWLVSKAAHEAGLKVVLSGVGGDELFAGYPIFKLWEKINNNRWFWKTPSIMRKAMSGFYNSNDIRKQRIRQLLQMDNCSISNVYPVLRQVNANATVTTLLKNPALISQLQKTLINKQEAIGKFPLYSQISISEYLGYTGQTLLKDTDQMSMANSLEVREPFFDHELIENVLRIPDNFKKGDKPKSLLINSLNNLIPPEIYERPKKGFVFPWNKWLRNELKSYCEIRIHTLSQRDFIQQKAVLAYWDDFLHHRNAVGYSNILLLIALENYIERHELK
jgi:asparagine synthase (glutamine-hydrolysing)